MTESLGQRLRRARESRHLTLGQVNESTRIRTHLLEALEADNYSSMTSAAQARGFLKNYADFLGIDLDDALRTLQEAAQDQATSSISGPLEQVPAAAPPPGMTEEGPPAQPRRVPTWLSGLARRRALVPADEAGKGDQAIQPDLPATASVPSTTQPGPEEQPDLAGQDLASSTRQASSPTSGALPAIVPPGPETEVEAAEMSAVSRPASRLVSSILGTVRRLVRSIGQRRSVSEAIEDQVDEPPSVSQVRSQAQSPIPTASGPAPDEIFAEIGAELRRRRELLSLTVEEIEKHIHVRVPLLNALEEGAFDRLPSTVQTRGMLANYGAFLDLDTDRLLLRFADALQARHRQKYPDKARAVVAQSAQPAMPPLRAFIAPDLLFGAGMTVVLVALAIWGAGRLINAPDAGPGVESTAPSISDVLAGTDLPGVGQSLTATPAQGGLFVTATPLTNILAAPTLAGDANIRLMVVAVERTFVRVTVDGEDAFSGRVQPGESYPFEGEEQVEILTGNGAALRVTFNGRDLGLLGSFGEVVSIIFTPAGIATPTPTVPPSPTPTPRVTVTPSPTSTPTETPIAVSEAR